MKRINKLILLSILTIIYNSIVIAKPRIVNVEKEIKAAKFIGYVTIDSYTDTSIAFSMTAIAFKLRPDSSAADGYDMRKELTARLRVFDKSFKGKITSGSLPKQGDRVLVVIDSNNYVSLFADISTDYLIFWSPVYTGSKCLFNYGNNFIADTTETQRNMFIDPWDKPKGPEKIRECSDKVFIETSRFFYNYTYDIYEAGTILMQDNDIDFIPEISFSRFYRIKKNPKLKLLDRKKIIAFGRLKDYSEFDIKEFKEIE